MFKIRLLLIALCVFGLAGFAMSQSAETESVETAPAPVEPILSLIPEDAIAFVVINNVKSTTANLDEYFAQIGLSDLVTTVMPGGSLGFLKGGMMLGPGFNPDGGLAAVMLDPEKFGMDLETMLGRGDPASQPVAEPAIQPAPPFVIFIAGSFVEEVLGMFAPQPGDPYTMVTMPMGPMHAATKGGYVVLSPSVEALTSVLQADPTPANAFGGEAEILNKAAMAVYMKAQPFAPIVMAQFEQFSRQIQMMGQMAQSKVPPAEFMDFYVAMYKELYLQVDSLAFGLRWVPAGLLIEESVTFQPESMLGKSMSLLAPDDTKLLDALVNLPYIMAYGQNTSVGENRTQMLELSMAWYDKWADTMTGLFSQSPEDAHKMRELTKTLYEQIKGVQFVIGGGPEAGGAFGMSYVLKCKDADVVQGVVGDLVVMSLEMMKLFEIGAATPLSPTTQPATQPEKFELIYTVDAETVGEVSVDTIEIVIPELSQELLFDEHKRAKLVRILGEDKVRFFVAKADAQTVVITFGGSTPFVAQALKAATEGGTIPADPKVQEVMRYMPENPFSVLLFNAGNLFSVLNKAAEVEGVTALPFNITSKTPIAIGASASGSTLTLGLLAPNELVSEVVGLVKSIFLPPPPQSPGQPDTQQPGTEQF